MNKFLLGTCIFALAGAIGPAWAQEAAPARGSSAGTVGDVVITAERRTQSVQSSSLAIQVLSASALADAGVSQVRDLTAVTPGVNIGQGGPATQIYVRGVGDFGSTPTFNAAVATYIDGVFVPRSNAIEGNMYDLSRVEVLKGPQGTLYGRNAAGGALNILTNQATLGDTAGRLNVEIGTYNEVNVDGSLNVPIGDDIAVHGAFQVISRDGYSSMGFDDDHKQSGRINTLWRPNDSLSLRVGGAWTHIGGIGPGYNFSPIIEPRIRAAIESLGVTIPTSSRLSITDPAVAPVIRAVDALSFFKQGPFSTLPTPTPTYCIASATVATSAVQGVPTPYPRTDPFFCNTVAARAGAAGTYVASTDPVLWQRSAHQDNVYWNLNAELNWDFGLANLTVIPAYRSVLNDYTTFPVGVYDDGGRSPEQSVSKSLEVRLANDTSIVDWTLGAYFFQERQHQYTGQFPYEDIGNDATFTDNRFVTSNWAAFAQGTWHLSDSLRLITGVRYSEESKKTEGASYTTFPSTTFLSPRNDCRNNPTVDCISDRWLGSVNFTSTNWKAGLEYDVTDHNMLFFTASTGFKSGGLNALSAVNTNPALAGPGVFTRVTTGPSLSNGTGAPVPYNPEELTAYELGSRNRFFDGRLQVNLEGFYWQYKAHQENVSAVIQTSSGPITVGSLQNTGDATMYGADIDIVARLTDNDTVRFNTEYLHTEYDTFGFLLSANVQQGLLIGCPAVVTGGVETVNCAGQPLTRAPEWSGSMNYTHTFDLDSGATIDASVSGQYATDSYLMPYYMPQHVAAGYFTVGTNVTYTSPDGDWTLQAWGRNLTDEDVLTGAFQTPGIHAGIMVHNIGAPRTYGIRLGVKF